jgi:hypothetical protein
MVRLPSVTGFQRVKVLFISFTSKFELRLLRANLRANSGALSCGTSLRRFFSQGVSAGSEVLKNR